MGDGEEIENDEAGWDGWEVDSDSSDSSESEGWIDVESDGDQNLDISDSEDDQPTDNKKPSITTTGDANVPSPQVEDAPRISTLATTKVKFSSQKVICI